MRAWASSPLVRDEKQKEKVMDGWMSDVTDVDRRMDVRPAGQPFTETGASCLVLLVVFFVLQFYV
jgi:hypothetical protein